MLIIQMSQSFRSVHTQPHCWGKGGGLWRGRGVEGEGGCRSEGGVEGEGAWRSGG